MSTTKEIFVQFMGSVAADYHRDFKHVENTKAKAGTTWEECAAPRCVMNRSHIAAFPDSLADDVAYITNDLKELRRRIDGAIAALRSSTARPGGMPAQEVK